MKASRLIKELQEHVSQVGDGELIFKCHPINVAAENALPLVLHVGNLSLEKLLSTRVQHDTGPCIIVQFIKYQ